MDAMGQLHLYSTYGIPEDFFKKWVLLGFGHLALDDVASAVNVEDYRKILRSITSTAPVTQVHVNRTNKVRSRKLAASSSIILQSSTLL